MPPADLGWHIWNTSGYSQVSRLMSAATQLISVTTAREYKSALSFVHEFSVMDDIAYHLQYLEFCYVIKSLHKPSLTTLNLLNKTIIVGLASIAEAILDDGLRSLLVRTAKNERNKFCGPLQIKHYATLGDLILQAKEYDLIDEVVSKKLEQLHKWRNTIHFKRSQKGRPKEYDAYPEQLLQNAQENFEQLIAHMSARYALLATISIDRKFSYPWEKAKLNVCLLDDGKNRKTVKKEVCVLKSPA